MHYNYFILFITDINFKYKCILKQKMIFQHKKMSKLFLFQMYPNYVNNFKLVKT